MRSLIRQLIKSFLSKKTSFQTNSIIKERALLNRNTQLEGKNLINYKVNIVNSHIGFGTYIGAYSRLNNTIVGRYCSIAENVKLISGNHPTKCFVSTHPSFFSLKKQAGFTYVDKTEFNEKKLIRDKWSCEVGNDVWLGANVLILEGVKIGDGAIVAAGAVVTSNLEPYYIYGGVPAKKIGERFLESEREFLLDFKWWNKDQEWVKNNSHLFNDVKKFMKVHGI
jgi:acetyltransferase-like isoleucine patch superfamily enzyme